MKLIMLFILCKPNEEEAEGSYKSVLNELNINGTEEDDSEYYWCETYYNVKVLNEELFYFYERRSNTNHTVVEFFDGRSLIADIKILDLKKLLENDTI